MEQKYTTIEATDISAFQDAINDHAKKDWVLLPETVRVQYGISQEVYKGYSGSVYFAML